MPEGVQLTLFHNAQLRALGLYDLLQLLQVCLQALDLIIIERNRLGRSLEKKHTVSPINPITDIPSNIPVVTYLLNIKSSSDINKHLLAIRQAALDVQRAGEGHENLIAAIGSLLLVSSHAIIDRAHTVTELGLGGAQLRVRGGQVFQFGGEAGLECAELRDGERGEVDWFPGD